jgi:hypothetical protein
VEIPVNRYRLFQEEKIGPKLLALEPKLHWLYCKDNGRSAVDPVMLCGVTLLQFMEKVADLLTPVPVGKRKMDLTHQEEKR